MDDSQSETKFAKCSCQHCGGHIEFDASYSGMSVKCPHCFETTTLLAQKMPPQEPTPTPVTPAKKKILSERELNKAWNKYNKFKARLDLGVNETKGSRISLTSSQLQLPVVIELLNLLTDITKNGLVNHAGTNRLHDWLTANPNSEIPALGYLLCFTQLVLAEGQLAPTNYPEFLIVLELQKAIERVLPKKTRDVVVEKRQIVETQIREGLPESKASESQLDYIRGLGGNPDPDLSVSDASNLIGELLSAPDLEKRKQAAREQNRVEADERHNRPAHYLRRDCEDAKGSLQNAERGEISEAKMDLKEAQRQRIEFWEDTFRVDQVEVSYYCEQTIRLYCEHGHRFKMPTETRIQAILDTLDAHSPTWDIDGTVSFYLTLEASFPELLRKKD
jgi:hypothetical protein